MRLRNLGSWLRHSARKSTRSVTTFVAAPPDEGIYLVTVTVTDNDGGSTTSDPVTINVTNADPTVSVWVQSEQPAAEGRTLIADSLSLDPGLADYIAGYSWTVSKVGDPGWTLDDSVQTDQPSIGFIPEDEGTYRLTLTVTDNDGASTTSEALDVVVYNLNPVAAIDGLPTGSVVEGSHIGLTADASDEGITDVLSYAWTVSKLGDAGWTAGVPLDQGTLDFDTPGFTLKLVKASQTIAALEPKGVPTYTPTPTPARGRGAGANANATAPAPPPNGTPSC